jgi:hypothetical protein
MHQRTTPIGSLAVLLGVFMFVWAGNGCTNTKYPDLMRVTAECDVTIANQMSIYNGSGALAERIAARERIVNLRKKQMIMAERIDVKTMSEVVAKTMTFEQGEAKKSELVKAAAGRYEDALKLPMPGNSTDGSK